MVVDPPHRGCVTPPGEVRGRQAPASRHGVYPPSYHDRFESLASQQPDRPHHEQPGEAIPFSSRSRDWKRLLLLTAGAFTAAIGLSVGLGFGLSSLRRHVNALGPNELSGPFNRTFSAENLSAWRIFDGTSNGGAFRCGFSRSAVRTSDDKLSLSVTRVPTFDMPASCAQLVYRQPFSYGRFSVRLQPAKALGVVTAFFLYTETTSGQNQEMDIEFRGRNTSLLMATSYRDANATTDDISLATDAAGAARTYAFDWRPTSIAWSVDGQERYRQTENLPRYTQQHLFLSTWLREPSEWAGAWDLGQPVPTGTSGFEWVAFEPLQTASA